MTLNFNLKSPEFTPISLINNEPFEYNKVLYASIYQAFYALVFPNNQQIRYMNIPEMLHEQLHCKNWGVEEIKAKHILLKLISHKIKTNEKFANILMKTKPKLLIADYNSDKWLCKPNNYYGKYLMIIRDKLISPEIIEKYSTEKLEDLINDVEQKINIKQSKIWKKMKEQKLEEERKTCYKYIQTHPWKFEFKQ